MKGAIMDIDETNYLTPDEAAAILGVHRSRMYTLFREGRYGQKIEGYVVFTRAEVEQYDKERAARPKGGRLNFHNRPKKFSGLAVR